MAFIRSRREIFLSNHIWFWFCSKFSSWAPVQSTNSNLWSYQSRIWTLRKHKFLEATNSKIEFFKNWKIHKWYKFWKLKDIASKENILWTDKFWGKCFRIRIFVLLTFEESTKYFWRKIRKLFWRNKEQKKRAEIKKKKWSIQNRLNRKSHSSRF